jgi:hypothetical protein
VPLVGMRCLNAADEANRIAALVDRNQQMVAFTREELRGPGVRRGSIEELGSVENELLVAWAEAHNPHHGDQMNGVVVVTATKPSLSRIGRLSSDASTWR